MAILRTWLYILHLWFFPWARNRKLIWLSWSPWMIGRNGNLDGKDWPLHGKDWHPYNAFAFTSSSRSWKFSIQGATVGRIWRSRFPLEKRGGCFGTNMSRLDVVLEVGTWDRAGCPVPASGAFLTCSSLHNQAVLAFPLHLAFPSR